MLTKKKSSIFIWNSLGNALSAFLPFLLMIYTLRFGDIKSSGNFMYFFYLSLQLGSITLFSGRIAQFSSFNKSISISDFFGLKIFLMFIMFLISFTYSKLSGFSEIEELILFILLISKVFESLSDVVYGHWHANNQLELVGRFLSFRTVIYFSGFVFLDILFSNLLISTSVFSLISMVFFIIEIKFSKIRFSIRNLNIGNVYYLFKSQLPVFLVLFIYSINLLNSRSVLKFYNFEEELGIFNLIVIPSSFLMLVSTILYQPQLPVILDFQRQNRNADLLRKSRVIIMQIFSTSIFLSLFLYYPGIFILSKLYAINMKEFTHLTILVFIFMSFSGVFYYLNFILSMLNKKNIQLVVIVLVTVACIPFTIYLVREFGLVAASIMYFAPAVIVSSILYIILVNELKKVAA